MQKTFFKLKKVIKDEKPDIVQAFNPIPVYLASFFKYFFKYKLVVSITGLGGAYGHGSRKILIFDQFYKFALKKANWVVFQNKDDHQYFIKKISNKYHNKIEVITSSGVDTERFRIKNIYDSEKNTFQLLFIARMIKQKGIKHLVEIARNLLNYSSIKINIYGEYDPNHNDAISKKRYDELLALSNVVWHGFVKEIEKQYIKHDILLCTSLREGVPRVILEASASGIPVVAYDVPGVREGVENGHNGYLVPAFDTNFFIKKIITLKKDKNVYQEISKNSRNYIENKFSQDSIMEKYMSIYEKLQ